MIDLNFIIQVIIQFFWAYVLVAFSTILHEISHLLAARKFGIPILKTKNEIRLAGLESYILCCSVVILGIGITPWLNCRAFFGIKQYKLLNKHNKKIIAIAGHVADLFFFTIVSIIFLNGLISFFSYIFYAFMMGIIALSSYYCSEGDLYKIRKDKLDL